MKRWQASTVRILTQCTSQVLIIRSRTTFRRHPVDDLVGIFDVAGLAVHAIGGVDLQAFTCIVLHDFIDIGGAEARARVAVFLGALCDAHGSVGNVQMDRLVFVVFGGGEVDAG
jgi:hypothetical protein